MTGQDTSTALQVALEGTAGIISTAGGMMAIAFSGLCFSSLPLLRQIGTLLVFGTLVDTWVMRPIVVPACMLVWNPELTWWPRKMPDISQDFPVADCEAVRNETTSSLISNTSLVD